jgi:hypothetical protein
LIVELSKVNAKTWNEALAKAESNGTIFQSTYWAEYLKTTFGDHPLYIASLDKKGSIQGLLLAIESCYGNYPLLTLSSKRGLLLSKLYKYTMSPLFHKMVPFIFWQNGPVILPQFSTEKSSDEILHQQIIEKIMDIGGKRKSYAIRFARSAFFDDHPELLSRCGFQKKRMGTILVDLDHPLQFLWDRIDRHARKNINKVEQDIHISKMSKLEELKKFYDLHVQSTRRLKIKTYPFFFFKGLWNCLSPHNKMVGFVAFHKQEPIGASISLMHNRIIHEYAYADSDYARSNRMYVIDALKWQIIRWAHDMNLRYLDLSGVELYKIDAGDEKARNIYRFKAKWGGQLVEYHDYQRILESKKTTKILKLFLLEGEGAHN